MQPQRESIDAMVEAAMREFDSGKPTSALVRSAVRIATARHDYANLIWLTLQSTSLIPRGQKAGPDDTVAARLTKSMSAALSADEILAEHARQTAMHARLRAISFGDKAGSIAAGSLGEIEQSLAEMERLYSDLEPNKNLTQIDTYHAVREADAGRAKISPAMLDQRHVLERVKDAVWAFLVDTELQLQEGQTAATIFDRAQSYINAALADKAPDAASSFLAAQDRLQAGGPEDLSHALTSCRRVIKALADALYPATNEEIAGDDGVVRMMTDEAYRNRLLQFVRAELGKHGQHDVIKATIQSLGARLTALDSLASKGVHDDVSLAEAETCIVWTYLLAGDILRVADGSSVLLRKKD